MFTTSERLTRCLDVMHDAFDGQPAYLEQEGDTWTGAVFGSEPKTDPTTGKLRPTLMVVLILRESNPEVLVQSARLDVPSTGQGVVIPLATYDDFAKWAYSLSRTVGLQQWVTPRHFAHLVSYILTPCPYNPSWPHEHNVTFNGGSRLRFWWDEDECRLVALFTEDGCEPVKYEFQHAGDAVGRLTLIKDRVQGRAPTA